jgi:hypothetical protein
MNKSLEELSKLPQLEYNQEVICKIGSEYSFTGKIVGLAHEGILPSYIVECLDGFIPNETYKYKTCIIPLCYIENWKSINNYV